MNAFMLDHFSKVTHMHTHTCVHTYTRTHACAHTHTNTTIDLHNIIEIHFNNLQHIISISLSWVQVEFIIIDCWQLRMCVSSPSQDSEKWTVEFAIPCLWITYNRQGTMHHGKIYTCTQIYNICDLVNYLPEHILKVVWSIYAAKVDVLY